MSWDYLSLGLSVPKSVRTESQLRTVEIPYEFDGDASGRVCALEVVDQLCQVLDGVDVVVRGRGDQTNAGDAVAGPGDVLGHLVPGF